MSPAGFCARCGNESAFPVCEQCISDLHDKLGIDDRADRERGPEVFDDSEIDPLTADAALYGDGDTDD